MEVKSDMENKFFIFASQLKDIKSTEKQTKTQKKHAKAEDDAFKVIQSNSRNLMACTQNFYSCDQKLKLQINLASTLLAVNGEIKGYRIATYAYRLTILDSVMTMIDKVVPMTLVPKGVLSKTLESVATHQTKIND